MTEQKIAKDKLKFDSKRLSKEFKDLGLNLYKVLVNTLYVSLYSLRCLGDLILVWKGSRSKKNHKEKKQKNILDEGW